MAARVSARVTARVSATAVSTSMASAREALHVCRSVRMRAMGMIVVAAVVLTRTDRLGAEDLIQILTAVVMRPLLDGFEHAVVDLRAAISQARVVEHAHAVVQDLFDRDIWVVPCVDDAGSDILKDGYGDLTGGLVQNVGEVVLGEHAVGRIGRGGDGPDLVLMLRSRVNDCGGPALQLRRGCLDDGQDEGGEQRQHEESDLLRDALYGLLQTRYLGDHRRYVLDHLVAED
jgi:hypothetical protein